ncbi:3254_t:CDS:2, partial [Cetraspora pellucida]
LLIVDGRLVVPETTNVMTVHRITLILPNPSSHSNLRDLHGVHNYPGDELGYLVAL